jgi:DNA-binding transcriptional regulator YdaS (Cro superfamily)
MTAFKAFYDYVCEHYGVQTQTQVATLLGVHQPQVNGWLNGNRGVPLILIMRHVFPAIAA